jgi:hypothetical protein
MVSRRWRTTSSPHGACTFFESFPFLCIDNKGEKIVIILVFHRLSFRCVMDLSSMCGGRGGQETYLCVACKTLMASISVLWILCLLFYLFMFGRYLCLSI